MKKLFFLFLFIIFSCFFSFYANAEDLSTPFVLKDITVNFSKEGFTPSAKCEDKQIEALISYFAIDTETSSPVSLPITEPGTYQIFASFAGNEKYDAYETSAFATIKPIKAKILTNYKTVAYSKMENPVSYSVEPSWAKDFLDISIDYFPIKSVDSQPLEKISAPVELGLYYTVFNVKSNSEGIICENKYMLYEIAAYRGKKLSSEERSASVPKSFTCDFQKLNTIYSEDTPILVQYTLSPAAISGKIMYKKIFNDGTSSDYTDALPASPGEYICGYFLENTCIGEGSIFIDKKEVSITINEDTFQFTPEGITPTAKCDNEKVNISFTAFPLDENGKVTMEEIPIPIKKCGKYSIIAYPTDTEYFKRTYSYGYIEITPATPDLNITKTDFIYDGKPKDIEFQINPSDVSVSVEYYEWDDRNNNIPIGHAPTREGKYLAIVTVNDESGNYNIVSKSSVMYIDPASILNIHSKKEILIFTIIGAIVAGAVGAGIVFLVKKRRYRRF
jgi:hypothetical protein